MEKLSTTIRSFASPDYLTEVTQSKYGFKKINKCIPLKLGGSNDIYLLLSEDIKYIVKIFSKRQCWPYNKEHYLFELELQSFLVEHQFPAPQPILSLKNELLETITLPEANKYFAVYSYIPGDKWDHKLTKNQRFKKLGIKVAEFHKLTAGYKTSHQLRKLDISQLLEKSWSSIDKFVVLPNDYIKDEIYNLYQNIKRIVLSCKLEALPLSLIHGDVHAGNNLYDSKTNELYLLDFELCGYGYISYEFATLKWDLLNSHKKQFVEQCMEEFFLGYNSVRSLDKKVFKDVDIFVKLRHFFMLGSSFLFYPDRPQLNSLLMLNYYIETFNKIL
jgi:Ser/Thr protein kinase RdoA (MazF antagonist)